MIGNSSDIIYDRTQGPAPKIKPEYIVGAIYKAGAKSMSKIPIYYEFTGSDQATKEEVQTNQLDSFYTRDEILSASKHK